MLYEEWIALQLKNHGTLEKGIQALNSTLNLKLTNSRINEYLRGKRTASVIVVNYMLQDVLSDQLAQLGLTDRESREILAAVSIPNS